MDEFFGHAPKVTGCSGPVGHDLVLCDTCYEVAFYRALVGDKAPTNFVICTYCRRHFAYREGQYLSGFVTWEHGLGIRFA